MMYHDEMFGKSMVKEERNGEIPLNFGISSYFWSFHHAFFRFILNLSAFFLQRNRLVPFFLIYSEFVHFTLFLLLPGRSVPQPDVNFIMVHHGIKTHLITGS